MLAYAIKVAPPVPCGAAARLSAVGHVDTQQHGSRAIPAIRQSIERAVSHGGEIAYGNERIVADADVGDVTAGLVDGNELRASGNSATATRGVAHARDAVQ